MKPTHLRLHSSQHYMYHSVLTQYGKAKRPKGQYYTGQSQYTVHTHNTPQSQIHVLRVMAHALGLVIATICYSDCLL